ncbi:tRNA adenosine deaminase-associated protein [Solicola sp. PLA-1-18]|uniref:tRNA adenosine deaminase-associated protein n=1 Tax=Solicola sp. PLA-1-18 TaxID=3380532 RepID=UPI003B80FA62
MAQDDTVDLAVAAYREEGVWQLAELPDVVGEDVDELVAALRPWPADGGVIGMVAVDEDFFVLARVQGDEVRLMLSDVTAVDEWPLASGVADLLDLPDPDDDEDPQPAGDMGIVDDLGVTAMDLAVMCDDDDLYPDEVLRDVAARLGFGQQLTDLVD